jgi:RNA polymerase sigma-70 factor, ECF subfamily
MAEPSPGEITGLLKELGRGNRDVEARLIPLVYRELHRLAAQRMARQPEDPSFQTSDLIHEFYMRLVEKIKVDWKDRSHFFKIASTAMREILVDHARKTNAVKHGGGLHKVDLDGAAILTEQKLDQILDVDRALTKLSQKDPRQVSIVEMKYFGGCSEDEISRALDISVRTVKRDWSTARLWLYREIR